jgi:Na+/proline symporter
MLACRDGRHAGLAVIWGFFCVVVVRTWPWIIVGLASLIYFPIIKGEDPELAFPKMMVKFLPGGMAGIVLAAFIAAFLSTIAANLNMAASYLMNDFYVRMIKPQAKGKGDYMVASRVSTVIVLLLAIFITWQMSSISSAWKYFAEIYAGTGFVMLFRWFWWRINAWTEISAMTTSFTLANAFKFIPFFSADDMFAVRYVIIIVLSTIVCLVVTFLTRPVESSHLEKFYKRVMPGGWWGPFAKSANASEISSASSCWIGWLVSVITIYFGLFGTGYLCLAKYKMAAICIILFGIGTYFSVKEISKISTTIKVNVKKPDEVKV